MIEADVEGARRTQPRERVALELHHPLLVERQLLTETGEGVSDRGCARVKHLALDIWLVWGMGEPQV